jgi:ADP-ribose pyrophosphatase YjhB (NUDIX family)
MNALQQIEVEIDYTNHRGERSIRRIIPIGIRFGSTEYHTELQWLMCANDLTKDDVRTFAMKDIHGWRPRSADRTIPVIADQSPRVCVAVVIRDDVGRILLLKRCESGSYPGQWCLAGGGVEAGETLFKACQREVGEETGLEVIGTRFLAVTETLGPPHLIGMVFEASIGEGDVHNAEPETHDAIGWFAMDRLPSPLMPGVIQWLIQTKQAWKTEECP